MPNLADVVIVGGGVLGTALAYELSRRTFRVVLLETRQLASGATGGSFAWINATAKYDDERYHRLNAQGRARYDALAMEFGAGPIGLRCGGALFWTESDDSERRAELRHRAALLQGWEYPATLVNRTEMQALEPSVDFGPQEVEGLFAPADRWVEGWRLTRFLAAQTRERHGEIREDCPATGFTRSISGSISTVETPQGLIATRLLILAAGLQTPELAAQVTGNPANRARVPVHREPGILVQTAAHSAPEQAQRVLYPPDAGGLHLRPTMDGGLLLGAEDVDATLDAESERVPAGVSAALLERTAKYVPRLADKGAQENATATVCVRPVPADGLPIVGALPDAPGVYVAVTHSGITLGPFLAALLAEEIVSGSVSPLLAPYRPDRFLS